VAKQKARLFNHGADWTDDEDKLIDNMRRKGKYLSEIAPVVGRTLRALEVHLYMRRLLGKGKNSVTRKKRKSKKKTARRRR
jgi:hypothetical protein